MDKQASEIEIGAALTIDTVKDLYTQFNATVEQSPHIVLKSEQVETIDLAGIQFLSYVKETSGQKDIHAKIELKFSESANDLLLKSGFVNMLTIN